MKSKSIIIIIINILILLLPGCAKHSKVILAPGYQKQFTIDAALAVVMLDEAPELIYFGDVRKSLKGIDISADGDTTPNKLIWHHFKTQLIKDIKKEIDVKNAFLATPKRDFLVTKEVVKTSEEEIKVEIPAPLTRIEFDSSEAALVLFMNHIRAGTETDPYYADRAEHGLYTATARKLLYMASFVLWDNRELKPICYGRIRTSTPIIREEATPADWETVSRDLVRQMFQPTGFVKPNK